MCRMAHINKINFRNKSMKKSFLSLALVLALSACSSSEDRQLAKDSYQKQGDVPTFERLDMADVNIVGQNGQYQLPAINNVQKAQAMDIRPPSDPIAIIGNSVAQFDGERASIIYPPEKKTIYNLQQIERLLTEKAIKFQTKGNEIHTEWTASNRADDIGNVQLQYLISEIGNSEANALTVSVQQAKRDNVIFTPSTTEKGRYTADFLNGLVGELNNAYKTQLQQVQTDAPAGQIQSAIVTDSNAQLALAFNVNFNQSWKKLAEVLPQLGFEIKEEQAGRGYRELKYKALDKQDWARFGVNQPELENGTYSMQLSAYGNESAVVISDEDKQALTGDKANALYQAIQTLMAK